MVNNYHISLCNWFVFIKQENEINESSKPQKTKKSMTFPRVRIFYIYHLIKVSKGAKIRNRYNQVPHLTQDTNGKVTNSQ